MSTTRVEVCAFCKWSACWNGPRERHVDYSVEWVECRRHAPTVVRAKSEGRGNADWPSVSNLHWCGDFERTEAVNW